MLRRGRRAERGYCAGDARLVQAHDVHVALDNHETPERGARQPDLVQAIELLALVEQRRLRRIQVFRLAALEHPAAETQHAAARIADRKHDAVAEAVIPGLAPRTRCVALDDQSRGKQRAARLVGGTEPSQHFIPGVGRVADAESFADRLVQPAAAQVGARFLIALQAFLVVARDTREHLAELFLAPRWWSAAAFMRHFQSEPPGERFDGFRKRQLFVLHQEAERRAVRAAAKAVIELLVRAHPERRGLLVVKRAAGLVLAPRLLQRHAAADGLDDIRVCDQLVNEALGNAAGHGASLTEAAARQRSGRLRAESRLDAGAYGTHVGAARRPGLDRRHHLAHVLDRGRAGRGDDLADHGIELGGRQLRG